MKRGTRQFDVASFVRTLPSIQNRLNPLFARLEKVNTQRAELDVEASEIQSQLEAAFTGAPVRTGKRGRPAGKVGRPAGKRRGRPASAKAKVRAPKVRKARQPKVAKAPRGTRGISTRDALLQVMPDNTSDGISKSDLVGLISKVGWKTTSDKPEILVGQALGKTNDFQAASRGKWRLTATGMKNRDKVIASGTATDAPEAPATPAAPAPAPEPETAVAAE